MTAILNARVPVLPGAIFGSSLASDLSVAYFIYSEHLYPRYVGTLLMGVGITLCALAAMIVEKRSRRPLTVPVWVPLLVLGVPTLAKLFMEVVEPGGTDWFVITVLGAILVSLAAILFFSVFRKPGGWLDRATANGAADPGQGASRV